MAKSQNNGTYTLVIKDGMPTVEEARARLLAAVRDIPRKGFRAMKIVHGYGSSGAGGSLQTALRNSLRKRKKEGKIKAFIAGEKFHATEEQTRQILELCPHLENDPDLNMYNEGITIVVF